MNRTYLRYCLTFLMLAAFYQALQSQELVAGAAGERIQVCTDRTMYVSGEKVLFSVIVYHAKDSLAAELSHAFYCELITPGGNTITGRKYLLQNAAGQGCLAIPDETVSGVYYLKFYTRFMRNAGTDTYTFIRLKIINPYKTEVMSGSDAADTTTIAGNSMTTQPAGRALEIINGNRPFRPREEIHLAIRENPLQALNSRICLSIVPESTYETSFIQSGSTGIREKSAWYLPETRGISISGQLIDKDAGKPVQDAKINLSIIGDRDILVVRTDTSGRFFFPLPGYHGKKDIFLCSDDLPGIKPEILIDNDFCSRQVKLPSPPFKLNETEKKAAYNLLVNSRVTSLFRDDTISGNTTVEENHTSFYGLPSEILVIEKYIDLPTLSEYFTELPGILKLRKVQGKRQFRFFTDQPEMSLYDPLILVDWVAVNDIEKILGMPPSEIERIELVNAPYVKGNITYGGIISFISRKNDFASIDLPTSGTFVNYRFLEQCADVIPASPAAGNIPDSRNTVYWNPAVQLTGEGTADVSFQAPDTPGRYTILLRRMTRSGQVLLTEETIVVKDK